jgi:mannosyltransferase
VPDPDPRPIPRWAWAAVAGALVAGAVLRFVTTSPLWLDEALSVNIASLPVGDIGDALRRDGHPPLYYVLLHGWMAVVGDGDVAVRALSGVWGLALLPLLWLVGRRVGGPRVAWATLAVAALSPYALRYSTETRMYAMVMVLVVAGWLLLDRLLVRPRLATAAGLAAVVAALLWTHYWAMWLLAVVGVALLWQVVAARRSGEPDASRGPAWAVGALVAGGLAFLPWLPTLLYQGSHTGTPWARPVRPTEMLSFTIADLGGGGQPEAVVLGWFLVSLVVVGVFGRRVSDSAVQLEIHPSAEARPFALVIVGTFAVATVTGYALGATYASRYAAVFVPFVFLLAGLGITRLGPKVQAVVLVALFGLGAVGAYRNVTVDRSDARRSAEAIEAAGTDGDLVVYCPDQLGPSTSRLLSDRFEQVVYPSFAGPELVDWVDYAERLEAADPARFAADALERAGDRSIFLVYSTSYLTHREACPELFNAFGVQRPPDVLTETTEAWEPSAAVRFAPPP